KTHRYRRDSKRQLACPGPPEFAFRRNLPSPCHPDEQCLLFSPRQGARERLASNRSPPAVPPHPKCKPLQLRTRSPRSPELFSCGLLQRQLFRRDAFLPQDAALLKIDHAPLWYVGSIV